MRILDMSDSDVDMSSEPDSPHSPLVIGWTPPSPSESTDVRMRPAAEVDSDGELRNRNISDELHRQQRWCTRYYKAHRAHIPHGYYAVVIHPVEEVQQFATYSEASYAVCRLPSAVGVLLTEHPIEDVFDCAY